MFVLAALAFVICGILLLRKAKKMPKRQGLNVVIGACAVAHIALGIILACYALAGKV